MLLGPMVVDVGVAVHYLILGIGSLSFLGLGTVGSNWCGVNKLGSRWTHIVLLLLSSIWAVITYLLQK
ncbi:hypothetical protein BKA56DRAFT_596206 [Ilyonectria sp. MPI-CAGE-AT-0026]|nr:hypothetical protein BKA56DRAFT_596206 [Ilyonectria sp. MPI-CAGE-AT-0026]